MKSRKKELTQEYKRNHPPMGVYQIRNIVNDKVLIGSTLNLPGILNRHRFDLARGAHRSRALQAEWNEFGGENFAFEILDELAPQSDPDHDYRPDLAFLEELWLEKLQPYGERGYNEPKKSSEERLRMIARTRSDQNREGA